MPLVAVTAKLVELVVPAAVTFLGPVLQAANRVVSSKLAAVQGL
jgi:hypothetical protein